MNIFKKIFKHIKGSQLVEKILIAAFSVSAGGAVIIYGTSIIKNNATVEVDEDDISGKTYGYNQLVQETKKNNSMPVSIGTGWRDAVGNICDTTINHKYIITAQLVGNYPLSNVQVGVGDNRDWNEGRVIFDQNNKDLQYFLVSCKTGYSGLDIVTVNLNDSSVSGSGCYINNVMIIDLTDWYGTGNEPSSISEFQSKFPKNYYPYQETPLELSKSQINDLGMD